MTTKQKPNNRRTAVILTCFLIFVIIVVSVAVVNYNNNRPISFDDNTATIRVLSPEEVQQAEENARAFAKSCGIFGDFEPLFYIHGGMVSEHHYGVREEFCYALGSDVTRTLHVPVMFVREAVIFAKECKIGWMIDLNNEKNTDIKAREYDSNETGTWLTWKCKYSLINETLDRQW